MEYFCSGRNTNKTRGMFLTLNVKFIDDKRDGKKKNKFLLRLEIRQLIYIPTCSKSLRGLDVLGWYFTLEPQKQDQISESWFFHN